MVRQFNILLEKVLFIISFVNKLGFCEGSESSESHPFAKPWRENSVSNSRHIQLTCCQTRIQVWMILRIEKRHFVFNICCKHVFFPTLPALSSMTKPQCGTRPNSGGEPRQVIAVCAILSGSVQTIWLLPLNRLHSLPNTDNVCNIQRYFFVWHSLAIDPMIFQPDWWKIPILEECVGGGGGGVGAVQCPVDALSKVKVGVPSFHRPRDPTPNHATTPISYHVKCGLQHADQTIPCHSY